MPICIYCKKWKESGAFSNREHVIPQSFGKFNPTNLILNPKKGRNKKVCNKCNGEFSKLERWLARDSYEGYIIRSRHDKKTSDSERRRVIIKVAEGEYEGVFVEIFDENQVRVMPQIGYKTQKNKWCYIPIEKLNDTKFKNVKNNLSSDRYSLRAFSLENEQAKKAFEQLCITFKKEGDIEPPETEDIKVSIEAKIDKVIRRVIAKIAFNFLAYFNTKYNVLNDAFDECRKFILYGQGDLSIATSSESILFDEKEKDYRRVGHIVVLNKSKKGNVTASVSLYNSLRYDVLLAHNFKLKNLKTEIGRIFNVHDKKIHEIRKLDLPGFLLPDTSIKIPNFRIITFD
ncbi:HNH endonuclease [Legionella pneumophila]|nr:HNH endonuclease [Legionella pneumophila]HAT4425251.1 HNH endonuclease [Legionella pneumophila]HAU1721762.1 HNH endonuclease [Legionella pneumophila]